MVPQREKGQKTLPKKYQLKDHPIFFKNSNISSRIPKAQPVKPAVRAPAVKKP